MICTQLSFYDAVIPELIKWCSILSKLNLIKRNLSTLISS